MTLVTRARKIGLDVTGEAGVGAEANGGAALERLGPYSPLLLLDWDLASPRARHRSVEGTLVFADVSGFTRLSEALARAGGKLGAEQMTDVINSLFGDLLLVAAARGGEMLKYGGDAILVFFTGDEHAARAVVACSEMQRRLRQIGRIDTGAGVVRLKMSVGVHTGAFDVFRVGSLHEELVIAGPATSACVEMEGLAEAAEVLCSAATVAAVGGRYFGGERGAGRLLRSQPRLDAPAPLTPEELVDVLLQREGVDPGAFLAEAVRTHLDQHRLEPDHRLATVAFLHLMGIDRKLADDGAEATAAALHETMTGVQEALAAFDVSFLATDLAADGTKIMAASGAPAAVPDDAGRMLLALRKIAETDMPLPVRSGVNRGHVFSGAVGPPFRRTFTTIGDVTNTAARVMGRAAGGQVLALAPVTAASVPTFSLEEQPTFVAKGKAEPLTPWAIGPRVDSGLSTSSTRSAPLIGRDRELEILGHLTKRAAHGDVVGADVVGEPGMGKSRLMSELIERWSELRWLRWICDAYEAEMPFASARRLLSQALGGAEHLDAVVEAKAQHLAPWLPLAAAVLGQERPATPASAALSESDAGPKTADVVAELIAVSLPGAVGVVVENTEWLDPGSADVLNRLPTHAEGGLLLCTTRREQSPAAVADAERVEVGPLEDDAAADLVRRLVGGAILDHDLRAIVSRAQGNPFFLRELAAAAGQQADLPESLESLLATRIDAMPSDVADALRVAAVVGRSAEISLLRDLIGDRVDDLFATGLVARTSPDALEFQHVLVRDVAYERLPYRRRRAIHLEVGLTLEARPDGADAGTLSLHFFHARDGQRSWRYAREAADRAVKVGAHAVAAGLYLRAIEARRYGATPAPADVREAWMSLGNARLYAGELDGAIAAFRSARALAKDDPVQKGRTHSFEGVAWELRGDQAKARQWYRRGLKAIGNRTGGEAGKWRMRLLTSEALTDLRQGHCQEAFERAADAAEAAGALGDQAGRAHALNVQYLAATELGIPDRRALAEEALELFSALDPPDLVEQANLLNNLGLDAQLAGDLDEALDRFESSRAAQEEAGNAVAAAAVDNNIAEIYIERGRLDEAVALLERAEGVFRAAGSWFALVANANLGTIAVRQGSIEHGRCVLEEALAEAKRLGLRPVANDIETRLAEAR